MSDTEQLGPGGRPVANEAAESRTPPPASREELAQTLALERSDPSQPRAVDPAPQPLSGDRYEIKRQLGAGGMGEVHLCRDLYLGREVAMKVMRPSTDGSEGRARFLREARVQGQLEHPAVVPVYDMALGTGDAPYFTMKRIQGRTFREIIDGLASGDLDLARAFSRRKLLAALLSASQALAFAHARGVVHRDLKPENVMLGELGEVYVLDWGIARSQGLVETPEHPAISGELPTTQVGSLVGTPGYMSPEQAKGELDTLSPRSDVYALGCLLFELLALAPYHDQKTVTALLAATLTKPPRAPSEQAPDLDIAPELDAIVLKAVALDPDDRFESARELALELERFLDGQRDAELRRELAQGHLAEARAALELAVKGGESAERDRARGMRELGRALALDPSNETALQIVTRVVMSSAEELPPEAEAALRQVELEDRTKSAKHSVLSYLLWIPVAPLVFWLGIKSWWLALALDSAVVAVTLYALWMSSTGNVEPRFMRISIVLNFCVISLLSAFAGPLLIVPGAAAVAAAAFMVSLRATEVTRRLVTLCAAAAIFLPLGAEWAGLMPPSYAFKDGGLLVLPRLTFFPPVATLVFLAALSAVQLTITFMLVGRAVEALKVAERKNFAQAYRLGQLLPARASDKSLA